MRQRRLMISMMVRPNATAAMKRALRVVDLRTSSMHEFERCDKIDLQVHPEVKHAYCGQHAGQSHTRKEQHDRFILAAQRAVPGSEPKRGALPWHGYAGRHGGVGLWIDLPVVAFQEEATKDEINRCERA